MNLTIPVSLLIVHFIGDFLLQSDWMALNKSKKWEVLMVHAFVYGMCFAPWGSQFAVITYSAHFFTDAITSRITSKLWFMEPRLIENEVGEQFNVWIPKDPNPRHWFFVMIGLDQLIHCLTLAVTYYYLFG